ncbi:MAG: hypothetical protein R3F11_01720 [Verrucomicrobiales bacterium]
MKLTLAAAAAAFALAACSDSQGPDASASPDSGSGSGASAIPDAVLLTAAPDGAVDVAVAKAGAKAGDKVVVKGFVGAREEPFVAGRAMLVLGDSTKLTTCDKRPGDTCETPWDACCDDLDVVKASTATIQVTDASGNVLKAPLKGFGKIKEQSDLVVVGTVDAASDEGAFIINAEGIYVAKP